MTVKVFERDECTMEELAAVKPGKKIVYHTGAALPHNGSRVTSFARFLAKIGLVYLFQERTNKPLYKGAVNWREGVGEFKYIAVRAKSSVPSCMRPS